MIAGGRFSMEEKNVRNAQKYKYFFFVRKNLIYWLILTDKYWWPGKPHEQKEEFYFRWCLHHRIVWDEGGEGHSDWDMKKIRLFWPLCLPSINYLILSILPERIAGNPVSVVLWVILYKYGEFTMVLILLTPCRLPPHWLRAARIENSVGERNSSLVF